jgi:hypothetical protein
LKKVKYGKLNCKDGDLVIRVYVPDDAVVSSYRVKDEDVDYYSRYDAYYKWYASKTRLGPANSQYKFLANLK